MRQISSYLDDASLKILVCSIVLSRLDYCNSLYYNLPKSTLYPLTKAFNFFCTLRLSYSYILPYLVNLHWLSLHYRSSFKISSFVFKTSHYTSPSYLSLQPPKRTGLRSSTHSQLFIISHSYAKTVFSFFVYFSGTLFFLILNFRTILFFLET